MPDIRSGAAAVRRALPIALVLLLLSSLAWADDPQVERRIAEQDRLDAGGARVRMLNEARRAVAGADNAVNRYLLGRAFGRAGELEKAREQFEWAIEKDPSFAYPYHGLGVYHTLKGNLAEAESRLKTAVRLDPAFVRAHRDLGKVYLQNRDRLAAEREFLAALRYAPDNHDIRILLAFQYMKEGRFERAIQELQVVLAKDPGNLAALKNYGVCLMQTKRFEEAARELEKYVAGNRNDFEAYWFLEQCYLAVEDSKKAIATLTRLLAVAPADAPWREEVKQEIGRIREGRPARRGGTTYEDLLKDLDDKDVEARRRAMRTLCSLEFSALPQRMVQVVTDEDKVMRTLAVKKLAEVTPKRSVPLLAVLLVHPRDRDVAEEVRGAAAKGLGMSELDAAVPVLIDALGDESFYVFKLVVAGLRRFTGCWFTEDPVAPIRPTEKAELAERWREWWAGGDAFSLKLDAVKGIVALNETKTLPITFRYLAELIADSERMVSERALAAFVTVTKRSPGTEAQLATAEGRKAVCERALEIAAGGS